MERGRVRRLLGYWLVVQSFFPVSLFFWSWVAYFGVKRRRWVERNAETEALIERRRKILEGAAVARAQAGQKGELQKAKTSRQDKVTPPAREHLSTRSALSGPELGKAQQSMRDGNSPSRAATQPAKVREMPGKEKASPPVKTSSKSPDRSAQGSELDYEEREREL